MSSLLCLIVTDPPQVSWIRHSDLHILTVGRYTYTADNRYQSIYNPTTDEWILQVIFDMFVPYTNCYGLCLGQSVRPKFPMFCQLNERENILVSSV